MRKYLYNIIGLFLLGIIAFSCDTAHQDVSPVVSPNDNPVATFVSDFSGSTVTEGDTITYSISLDKPYIASLTFSVKVTGGQGDENDIEVISGTIPAFKTETEVKIIISADDLPEESETIDLELGVFSAAERYVLNPSVVYPTPSLTITNYNDPDVLSLAFGWGDDHDDFDIIIVSEAAGPWGSAETSDNPEICTDLWPTDDDGTYYLDVLPYDVSTAVTEYTISIGYPDQSVEFIEGTFDMSALATYTVDSYSGYDIYRVLKIVKSGENFTITSLP